MTAVGQRYDDPAASDQQLLERSGELRLRDTLSRSPEASKARMTEAGCDPAGWAPLTAEEHLERLQVERWLERRMASGRPSQIRRTREAGVPWAAIGDALGMDVAELRDEYAAWIDGQHQLHDSIGIGLDDDQAAAAWLLLEDDPAGA